MGNAGSGSVPRDRTRVGEIAPASPGRDGQVFTFSRNAIDSRLLHHQGSHDDDEPYFTRSIQDTNYDPSRPRSNTVSEGGSTISDKTPTVFRWEGGGKDVQISGTFSDWKTLPMVKSHGDFVTIIDLPEGEHQYKFFVDGEWKNDPSTSSVETEGAKNNLIVVKKSDFEVFQALEKDSENAPTDLQEEFSQIVPPNNPWQKTSGPPILPPHLLQVILNKDTPLSCEPTLLPEPNHVMLNHLYALSIKEGVMVLSATHRYRKKYVTTLLYKPI